MLTKITDNSAKIASIQNSLEEDANKKVTFENNQKNIKDTKEAEVLKTKGLLEKAEAEFANAKVVAANMTADVAKIESEAKDAIKKVISARKTAQVCSSTAPKTILNDWA